MYYWFKYWVSMFGEFEEPHVDPWPMSGWPMAHERGHLRFQLQYPGLGEASWRRHGCQWENYNKWHWSLTIFPALEWWLVMPFSSIFIHFHQFFIHFIHLTVRSNHFRFCCSHIIRRAAWSLKIPPPALGRTSWAQQKWRFCKVENGHRKFVDLPMKNADVP